MKAYKLNIFLFFCFLSYKGLAQKVTLSGELRYMASEARVTNARLYIPPYPTDKNEIKKTNEAGEFGLSLDTRIYKPGSFIKIVIKITENNQDYDFELEEVIPANYNFIKPLYVDRQKARKIIFGTVRDEKNRTPLRGIKVYVKTDALDNTSSLGEETDESGSFIINISKRLQLREFNAVNFEIIDPTGTYLPNNNFADIRSSVELTLKRNPKNIPVKTYSVSSLTRAIIKDVSVGDKIIITANGSINLGTYVGNSTPDGRSSGVFGLSLVNYNIEASLPHAALMYRIAGSSKWLLCGHGVEITATSSGPIELLFQINDNNQNDNHGAYKIELKVDNSN